MALPAPLLGSPPVHAAEFAAAMETPPRRGSLSWGPCPAPSASRAPLECATLSVPLDHSRPLAEQLPLTIWRLRATGPGPRLGTLVLLDGAPGAADSLSLEAMARAITPRTRCIFVCTPNNPTGTVAAQSEVDSFLDQVPDDVLVEIGRAHV